MNQWGNESMGSDSIDSEHFDGFSMFATRFVSITNYGRIQNVF
jgi:hypothetical protein